MDDIILAAQTWARKARHKLVSPLIFINFLQSKESPLPPDAVINFFSRPSSIYDKPWGWDAPPTVNPEALPIWDKHTATWPAIQNCSKLWSSSMSWRAQNEPSKIVYDYAVMQNISANIIYAAGKLSSKYKKQIILDWNICSCCWRIALNSKRCPLHEFSNSKEVKKSQRIKQNADFIGVITSDLLSNIYSKIKSNDIKDFLDDLPLTKQYLLRLNTDLSNNRKIIDALDEYGDEQQRFDLHDAMSKDTFKARGIFAKCEFWLQLEAKRGSWGGRRPGAGTRATTNP